MTAICAIECEGVVWMGGDAFLGGDEFVDICDIPKVYKIGQIGIGICGSVRCEQLFDAALRQATKKKTKITREWLQNTLTEIVRHELSTKGSAATDNRGVQTMPDSSHFLIAHEGKVYKFDDDFSLSRSARGYAYAGIGGLYTAGAIEAMAGLDISPAEKIERALKAAENLSPYVRGPFTIIKI